MPSSRTPERTDQQVVRRAPLTAAIAERRLLLSSFASRMQHTNTRTSSATQLVLGVPQDKQHFRTYLPLSCAQHSRNANKGTSTEHRSPRSLLNFDQSVSQNNARPRTPRTSVTHSLSPNTGRTGRTGKLSRPRRNGGAARARRENRELTGYRARKHEKEGISVPTRNNYRANKTRRLLR